jgi:phenylacetate-CoA oxygenase PaaH subunit
MAEEDAEDEATLEETHHPEIGGGFSGERGERFAVFVQWETGEPHQYEETVVSSDSELALSQARQTIERRWNPESIWVVSHEDIMEPDDQMSLAPTTDRDYRTTGYYARNMEMPDIADEDEEVFG